VAKPIVDGAKGILWVDDSYIVELHLRKQFDTEDFVELEVGPVGS
jgi:Holliday junction resolvase RusA-like endonuclease